ncbi:MAG: signal recognition particle-docking protein FtsY [Gammaproteobacteria bacterium]|nr:signal recognition particle-docking protein FtsY [Gammaproteobacteria bacterium]
MYRKITFVGLLLAFAVMAAGALARLQQTALLFDFITAQSAHFQAAIGLTAIAALLLILSWWQRHCHLPAMMGALLLSALMASQIALGIGLLKTPGQHLYQLGHLMTGMAVLWSIYWLHLRTAPGLTRLHKTNGPLWFSRFSIGLLLLQIVLGALVGIYQAGAACPDFPACNGQWLPDADYTGVINILRADGGDISIETLVALNWLHRAVALVCFVLFNGLMLVATAVKYPTAIRKAGLWLSFLLFVQVGLGIIGFKFAMPEWINIAHTLFAALLMLPLIAIGFYSRFGQPETDVVVSRPQPKPAIEIPSPIPTPIPAPIPAPTPKPEAKAVVTETTDIYVEPAPESLYLRLKSQLGRTRAGLGGILSTLQIGQKAVNKDLLEELEDGLLMADVGIDVTTKIINNLNQSLERHQLNDAAALRSALQTELLNIITPCNKPLVIPKKDGPFVILVVGVNGVGKTTTIGKLAKRLQAQGHSVMLAAGDTFRAAAVEQLQTWGERNNIQVVAQHTGADSASVIFDGIQSAQAKGIDVLIADTAGRLHTKDNLMEELKKVKRIMGKLDETAPHEVLLVLDAGTGQNALSQAKQFNEAVALTGLALTKLDGTAKGGVIFALAKQCGIPIRFIGVGEGIDDLQDFNAEAFVNALFIND